MILINVAVQEPASYGDQLWNMHWIITELYNILIIYSSFGIISILQICNCELTGGNEGGCRVSPTQVIVTIWWISYHKHHKWLQYICILHYGVPTSEEKLR